MNKVLPIHPPTNIRRLEEEKILKYEQLLGVLLLIKLQHSSMDTTALWVRVSSSVLLTA